MRNGDHKNEAAGVGKEVVLRNFIQESYSLVAAAWCNASCHANLISAMKEFDKRRKKRIAADAKRWLQNALKEATGQYPEEKYSITGIVPKYIHNNFGAAFFS